jgi:hypothetical protein
MDKLILQVQEWVSSFQEDVKVRPPSEDFFWAVASKTWREALLFFSLFCVLFVPSNGLFCYSFLDCL